MTTKASPQTRNRRDVGRGAAPAAVAVTAAPPREVWPLLGSLAATELAMVAVILWASSALDAVGALAVVAAAAVLVGAITQGGRAAGIAHALGRVAHRRSVTPLYTLGNGS